jgi:hypothetical protein
MGFRTSVPVAGVALMLLCGCANLGTGLAPNGVTVLDGGDRRIESLQVGSSLRAGARGLEPGRMYEVRVAVGDRPAASALEAVSFARISADQRGEIAPFILWHNSGVVGCSPRIAGGRELPRFMYRTFEDAERDLAGQSLTISFHPVDADPSGRIPPLQLAVREAAVVQRMPLARRTGAMVYASDASGCPLNSGQVGTGDMFVSGRNFESGEEVVVSVAPNQRAWRVNDTITDVTGANGAPAPERTRADERGRFTVRVWDRASQGRGVFDIVAQRSLSDRLDRRIRVRDIVSAGSDTGYVLYLLYPIGGPTMDIAGRPISGSPYFQFADSFAVTADTVWGAVDPTYVPVVHPGGTYAAYYVVNHRDVAGWDPTTGGAIDLVDVSGGIEIMPVKSGCVNGTDVPIWNSPLALGSYDVVVDFGLNPAETQAAYATDSEYNESLDFLDGADQVGFVVAPDPYELGPTPIGEASYSQDDFFPTLGMAMNVDLRAVVRYPATAAGAGTPVAPGAHPIFIIQHGNHKICEVVAPHSTCPDRTLNHMGYMRLLEIFASHGIIAVSIDAYDLTGPGIPQWIPERSQLILKHLELWSHMNDPATFPAYPDFLAGLFAGHVDMSKISVCGHSRGGEASVGAYMLNTTFTIGSVSSIAPVDGQLYVLPEVPYFVILPASDGDVTSLSGQHIYDRAGSALPTPDSTDKSTIYVYGANHNFFNTVWADDGDDSFATRDDYIDKADQQRLGEAYLAAFTRIHLLGETVYEDMLRGQLVFPSTAGFKIFYDRHEKTHSKIEAGANTGSPSGATAASVTNPSVHRTQAVQLGWSAGTATVTYTIPVAQRDTTGMEVLSFRVARTHAATNPAGNQDFQVELVGGGNTRGTFASRFDIIPPPYNNPEVAPDHTVMTTVRIPLHSFIMNKSNVTLNNVDTIRFRFTAPAQGEVYVDDIEFSR